MFEFLHRHPDLGVISSLMKFPTACRKCASPGRISEFEFVQTRKVVVGQDPDRTGGPLLPSISAHDPLLLDFNRVHLVAHDRIEEVKLTYLLSWKIHYSLRKVQYKRYRACKVSCDAFSLWVDDNDRTYIKRIQ